MPSLLRVLSTSLAALLALAPGAAAVAQDARWPSRPIRLVVTFPPGGTSDLVARLIAPKLSAALGQQVVVENRPGAGGIVGADAVAKAAPDGYTLVVSTVGSHGIGPTLNRNIRYDAVTDFSHLVLIGAVPHVLLVNPRFPARNLAELVAAARAQPGRINYGSGGSGSINHVTGELFKARAGIDLVHVPYKGSGAAITDLRGFTIPVAVDALPANLGLIRSGELRALGITSRERSPLAPEVPTFVEQGFADLVVDNWIGISGPARLPEDIARRLVAETEKAVAAADVRDKLREWGMAITVKANAEFAAFVRADIAKWRPVIIASGAQVD
ncbi:MAG: tripartite tricarboxylate transporter substrate binding protein [Burkholderiales bacterium]|nr:tripartite tricarboxylate transporter substrate binding protein [Burkholderiales bacterium]